MLKKSVTYMNYNGDEVSEDIYFNLTKAELIELELSRGGGLAEALKKIVAAKDGREIIKEFKNIIMVSYGEKSDDGRRFIKNQDVLDAFMSSEVYSEFFMGLITVDDAAANFINAIIPPALVAEATAAIEGSKTSKDSSEIPAVHEVEDIPRSMLTTMSPNDKARVMMLVEKGEARIVEDA